MEKNDFDVNETIGYAHPKDLEIMRRQLAPQYRDADTIYGVTVEEAPHIERGVFVLTHIQAARFGARAIQTVGFDPTE